MPQITLEISDTFDINIAKKIIDESQVFLVEKLPTKLETFKSRIYRYIACSVGGDLDKEIIHLQIKVLAGRTQEHLNDLVHKLKLELTSLLDKNVDISKYNLTLEMIELSSAYAN
ncbi:hypothetical protein LO80_08985 [Candidatus Francisella endociliophora]|uniref:5-carboxymethyl-2-hydroxymuconate isomerase n=1 Tax=Candidatus Francisella endociliophora TaxID=653937 RepID=A0A097ERC1_9GAMM|nr:hypothetical protein [Francisella sp. FSC1006]AIT10092.1 hypothetical protein LO80_08985 [Francisella sp. FSC1006]